jgi:hypothetical protein
MHPLTEKAREVLNRLVEAFDQPETLVDTLARAALIPNTSPCIKWSPCNRFLVALRGTSDARGFRQWQEAGRQVKKGAKAFHILVPRFTRSDDEDTREEERKLIGFVSAAVFAIEDTDGPALRETVPPQAPKLRELADRLGIPVTYAGAASDRLEGVYTHRLDDGDGATGRITLYTHGLDAFYHELAHALHHRTGKLRNGSDSASKRDNEIVAEVSAAVLVRLFEGEEIGRQAIGYIRDYGATKTKLLGLLPEIMEVVGSATSEPIPKCVEHAITGSATPLENEGAAREGRPLG